jgi:hypothetical protein
MRSYGREEVGRCFGGGRGYEKLLGMIKTWRELARMCLSWDKCRFISAESISIVGFRIRCWSLYLVSIQTQI